MFLSAADPSLGVGQVDSDFLHLSTAQQEAVNFQAHIALISVSAIIFSVQCQGPPARGCNFVRAALLKMRGSD